MDVVADDKAPVTKLLGTIVEAAKEDGSARRRRPPRCSRGSPRRSGTRRVGFKPTFEGPAAKRQRVTV